MARPNNAIARLGLFADELYRMKAAAEAMATASDPSVIWMRVQMDIVISSFLKAKQSYQRLVQWRGSPAAAREWLASNLLDTPADVTATLADVQTTYNALLAAWGRSIPGPGVRAFTFDGSQNVDISAASARDDILTEINDLRTALEPLTPVA